MLIYPGGIPILHKQFLHRVVSSRHPPNEHISLVQSHINNTVLPERGKPGTGDRVQIGRWTHVELEWFPVLVDLEAGAA